MYITTNYHTHSTFCDGKNTPEEIVREAEAQGIAVLGFSSHTMYPFTTRWHLNPGKYEEYFSTIEKLKKEYRDSMEILCGIEAEYFSGVTVPDKALYAAFKPDYIIGSVHYIFPEKSGALPAFFAVDGGDRELREGIQKHFKGNAKKAVQTYFAFERDMIRNCNFDIIGHPDLVRKKNGALRFFDETESWYRRELKETAKVIAQSGKVAEINTGGMSRAGMTSPYPSADFLRLLRTYDVPLMLNSDSHEVKTLTDYFETGLQAARQAGYEELWYLSGGVWRRQSIPAPTC